MTRERVFSVFIYSCHIIYILYLCETKRYLLKDISSPRVVTYFTIIRMRTQNGTFGSFFFFLIKSANYYFFSHECAYYSNITVVNSTVEHFSNPNERFKYKIDESLRIIVNFYKKKMFEYVGI